MIVEHTNKTHQAPVGLFATALPNRDRSFRRRPPDASANHRDSRDRRGSLGTHD